MELEELAAWIDWELLGDHEDSTTASSGDSSSEEEESEDSFCTCDEFSSDGEASVASEDLGRCLIVGRWTSNGVARYCRARLDRWEDWRGFTWQERLLRIVFQALVDLLEEKIRSETNAYLRSVEP